MPVGKLCCVAILPGLDFNGIGETLIDMGNPLIEDCFSIAFPAHPVQKESLSV
jgi:hypothetical protein